MLGEIAEDHKLEALWMEYSKCPGLCVTDEIFYFLRVLKTVFGELIYTSLLRALIWLCNNAAGSQILHVLMGGSGGGKGRANSPRGRMQSQGLSVLRPLAQDPQAAAGLWAHLPKPCPDGLISTCLAQEGLLRTRAMLSRGNWFG